MILVTKTFLKELRKIGSVQIPDIQREVGKYPSGLSNFVPIGEIGSKTVLKGYLNSKKVRIIILFQEKNGSYFPFYVVRKETKNGYNITSNSIPFLENELSKHYKDLDNGDFEKIDI